MKTMTFALVALLMALSTMGFNCINDAFQVAVNMPITATYDINPGTPGPINHSTTKNLSDFADNSYLDKIQAIRVYDVRITTIGDYSGSVSNGVVAVDGATLFTFSGTWNAFHNSQSILGTSSLIHPNTAGMAVLMNKLNQFKSNSSTTITISTSGNASGPAVPAGLQVKIEIMAQFDAQIGGGSK